MYEGREEGLAHIVHRRAMRRALMTSGVLLSVVLVAVWLVLPNDLSRRWSCRNPKVVSDIKAIERVLQEFASEHDGTYPEMLETLLEADEQGRIWLDRVSLPMDPWLNPYAYEPPREGHPLRVISYGSDGAPGGEGNARDIDNWMIANGDF